MRHHKMVTHPSTSGHPGNGDYSRGSTDLSPDNKQATACSQFDNFFLRMEKHLMKGQYFLSLSTRWHRTQMTLVAWVAPKCLVFTLACCSPQSITRIRMCAVRGKLHVCPAVFIQRGSLSLFLCLFEVAPRGLTSLASQLQQGLFGDKVSLGWARRPWIYGCSTSAFRSSRKNIIQKEKYPYPASDCLLHRGNVTWEFPEWSCDYKSWLINENVSDIEGLKNKDQSQIILGTSLVPLVDIYCPLYAWLNVYRNHWVNPLECVKEALVSANLKARDAVR